MAEECTHGYSVSLIDSVKKKINVSPMIFDRFSIVCLTSGKVSRLPGLFQYYVDYVTFVLVILLKGLECCKFYVQYCSGINPHGAEFLKIY